jgi:DNA-directed RNA polymerase specialized sigma24 family protein
MTTLMATQTEVQDETELAKQALHDIEAFAELYRYHMAHTGNIKDAEDLSSQTFVAALEGIRTFCGAGSFAPGLWESHSGRDSCSSEAMGSKPYRWR